MRVHLVAVLTALLGAGTALGSPTPLAGPPVGRPVAVLESLMLPRDLKKPFFDTTDLAVSRYTEKLRALAGAGVL
ncbi:MAG: hypothetical protein HY748_13865 [Elusimicrobia bacterium]|nr:hypothetical protein [Elusimicrobiota bacterium]